jgi:uncharacterized protein (DUF1684 family)
MRSASLILLATLLVSPACDGSPSSTPAASTSSESTVAATKTWRAKHEDSYRREYVSISGLDPLKPGTNSAGSAAANDIVLPASTPATIGRFILENAHVRFEPAPGAGVLLDGKPVREGIELRDDSQGDADELTVGDVRMVVHSSGDALRLRVRDPQGPLAKGFAGFTWFPIDLRYRVTGHFVKDAQPRHLKVVNTYGEADELESDGVVDFTLDGRALRLRPFKTERGRLFFVFKDASSGHETYNTARFLYSDLQPDGTVVLDFNQAYNPPCAFNPYTTCPLPLRENQLPVKILAGEQAYRGHAASAGDAATSGR